MKHILVATDLSPRADRAVERAFRLAGSRGARLTVLTVTDDAMPDRLVGVMQAETRDHLKSFCDSLSDNGRIAYDARVEKGDASHLIPEIASEVGADLILLGLHRRRPFLDSFRETTLERVVRLCSEPVLLIREHADHSFRTVLAAVDFSPAATAALQAAHALAPAADIHAFHAVHVPITSYNEADPRAAVAAGFLRDAEVARSRWMDLNALPEGMAPPKIERGGLTGVFQAELLRLKPDLIALGAHARFGITHRMLGGFARGLVADPPADLLIAKPAGG